MMGTGRWVLLVSGVAVIAVAGLVFDRSMEWWALWVMVGINVIDLLLGWAGPMLHLLRNRGKPPEPVADEDRSSAQVPIPDTVKQRSRDVKRRLGGETLAATDRRSLMEAERRKRLGG